VGTVITRKAKGELVQVGLANNNRTLRSQCRHDIGIDLGQVIEITRATRSRESGNVDIVLDCNWGTRQNAKPSL
jgi:hypothetical protein